MKALLILGSCVGAVALVGVYHWLRSVARALPDEAWKPTGLKFTTGRDYDQDQGIRMAREARLKSSTGRTYRKPAKPKQPAPVVSIRRQG